MSPAAQRIAIAEACGHVWFKWGDAPEETNRFLCLPRYNTSSFIRCGRPSHGMPINFSTLPDYLNDLNAMNEAEKTALDSESKRMTYASHLERILDRDTPEHEMTFEWGATATQRAEALLRTLNLWTPTAHPISPEKKT